MTSKFIELVIDCADPNGLARFWCSVLDYEVQTKTTELSQLGPLCTRQDSNLQPSGP
ncbi:VOC family protein [Streptomyces sp. NPDC019443]|uniref:VOC family protein n=1 Tax=Streptomyces sp. NPDC019443 TaxID=3365061 RepID=UPI0037982A2A